MIGQQPWERERGRAGEREGMLFGWRTRGLQGQKINLSTGRAKKKVAFG